MEYTLKQTSPIKVYVKINDRKEIVEVNSEIFLNDLTGWVYIDEGYGDKYAHAQTQYFQRPLKSDNGKYNYSLIDNNVFAN